MAPALMSDPPVPAIARVLERVGHATARGVDELGFAASLLGESLYWTVVGRWRQQPVRLAAVVGQMMEIGVRALPIVTILSATIGAMLAIQGIDTLESFGAESQVVIGIAIGVTREFAPMITGIVVAGRSGSALAARLGTMRISQEIDALMVMGIEPVRYLAAPPLVAMLLMLPALTVWSDAVALLGAGGYVAADLGIGFRAFLERTREVLVVGDVLHGLAKSLLFAVLVTVVGVVNGASVTGGAEGVGRATTRSVVHAIAAIVIADMLVAFLLTR
jgi:phospholipid/cholesterol/gamma-HCH transport system permease protein